MCGEDELGAFHGRGFEHLHEFFDCKYVYAAFDLIHDDHSFVVHRHLRRYQSQQLDQFSRPYRFFFDAGIYTQTKVFLVKGLVRIILAL